MEDKTIRKHKEIKILILISIVLVLITLLASSYAVFTYSRTGDTNTIETGLINFSFSEGSGNLEKGNVFPIEESDIDNTITRTFSITANSDYSEGIRYRVYVVHGDNVSGKTRLRDDVISFEFTPPADANGFTNNINACATASSLTFVNGKALVASGTIKDTSSSTTKSYTLKMFIDSNKINVSSTTKRATNAEGNPSLASTTSGLTTATRYMRNDTTESKTVTLYPASESQKGHIIYTTNEFSNSFYSFKILVEAEDNRGTDLVYLDTQGGSLSGSNILYVTPGENYPNLPQPTRTGYTFLGWNGKNLLNLSKCTFSSCTFNSINNSLTSNINNGYYATTYANYLISYFLDNLGETFTYSMNERISGANMSIVVYGTRTGGATYQETNSNNKNEVAITLADDFTNITRVELRFNRFGSKFTDTTTVRNNFQLELGSTATAYEPYFVDDTVTVTQDKDHVLKAIWQKNS